MMKPKITLRLDDPHLTMLHSAGIAGLGMTLKQLDLLYPDPNLRPGGLNWSLDEVGIELFWTGDDVVALDWLLSESFKIDDDGLISLTGLVPASMDIEARIGLHQGIKKSFLQHGSCIKHSDKVSRSISIDGKVLEFSYKKATSYVYQTFGKKLCDRKGQLATEPIGIKGWLYPGATVRHNFHTKETIFKEPPQLALALLFAPLACQFFFLPSNNFFNDPKITVVVVPAITNLITASERLSSMANISYRDRCISHSTEAGWRFFDRQINQSDRDLINSCQVITFQSEQWSNLQRFRSNVEIVDFRVSTLDRYQQVRAKLSANRLVTNQKTGKSFLLATKLYGLIIENVIRGSPCFSGFSQFVADKDCWQELIINRLSMGEIMSQDELSNNQAYKIFVIACHKALRTEYAKLFDKAKDDDYIQLDKLRQKIRHEIIVCVDAKSFRRWLVRFWSGCSENVADFNDIDDLLPSILVESDWELFQDLALVSLVTYQKAPKKLSPPPVKEDSLAKKLAIPEDSTT